MYVGIDVGGERLHCVSIDARGEVIAAQVFLPDEGEDLVEFMEGAEQVAIDCPSDWSIAPHQAELTLPGKFQPARCAEIALRADYRIAVPWVTPTEPSPGWMLVGIATFRLLEKAGHQPVEVYPHGAFRRMAGGQLPRKQTLWGVRDRAFLLRRAGIDEPDLELWSHDSLDAGAAAVVARSIALGTAVAASHESLACDDGSRIYLPPPASGSFILPSRVERFTWKEGDIVVTKVGEPIKPGGSTGKQPRHPN